MRNGYNDSFLDGVKIEMPEPSLSLEDDILQPSGLEEGAVLVPYIHYSVLMSMSTKQALVSAANLDQEKLKQVKGRRWFVDPRIGRDNQIDNSAYKNNPWDRGHLTRRTAVTWGETDYLAKRASNDSCSYANACLQHGNFNQDEWRVPERIVQHFKRDKDGKLTVMTGPIFTAFDRFYSKRNLIYPVRIPSGFWKLVAYIGNNGSLECQAYVMFQDNLFNADKSGAKKIQAKSYQVTTTELELWTGLDFPKPLYDANPLTFYANESEGIEGPESIELPETDENGEPKERAVFEKGDIKNDEIVKRRKSMKLDDFYDFIEGVSWI